MPTAHKVLVRAGESALGRTSTTATATSVVSTSTSDGSTKEISGRWSEYEHKLFLQGLEQHGKKWEKIAAVVETRTRGQIQSHAQKYFAKLESAKTKETDQLEVEDESRMLHLNLSWDERFQQLVEYKEQNGHCRVPKRYKANTQLGSWVRTQRHLCKKNKLLPEQKDRLNGIGFEWELRKHLGWDERLEELVEYKEQNGHCRVPQRYKDNPQLGDWVNNQRQRYKKNKLLPEQIKSLEVIGFEWELLTLRLGWNKRLEELKQYRQVNGHCRVPQKYKDNPQLGDWETKETNDEEYCPEKLKQKDKGGKKSNVSWDERFQQLVEYKEQNGHCRVPQRYKVNPQLGKWVSTQRTAYKNGKLLPEQKDRLEGIGFEWELPRGGHRS